MEDKRYLGDGVYAIFDGYSILIAVNHHENIVVTLEPQVLDNLNKFVESIKKENDK